MKRCSRAGAIVVVVALALSAFAADKGPIKVGFETPLVGVWAQNGRDMNNGFRMAMEESGYKAGGRQITVITEDTEGKPEVGLVKTRKLVESDKVDIIGGILNTAVSLAIRDYVIAKKVPVVMTISAGVDLTGKLKTPWMFRASFANGQQDVVAGWYAYNKLGYKRMIIISPDAIAGHEKADGFIKTFKASGGQIVDEIYPPPNTSDFGPYLSKIQANAKQVDAVWMFFFGTGAIRLVQQWDEYGLKKQIPAFVIGDTVDDSYLPALKEAAVGIKNYSHYSDTLDLPENRRFADAYLAKYKEYPSLYAEAAYDTAKVILLAIDAVKGDVENKEALLAAMRKVRFNAPRGPFRFDATQNAIISVYLRDVRKVGNRYANVVLEKIADDVDQNWTPAKLPKAATTKK